MTLPRTGAKGKAPGAMSMARCPQSRVSFFDPEFADPSCLEPGSLPRLLSRFRRQLFGAWMFAEWRPAGQRGPKGGDAAVPMSLLLLRWSEESEGAVWAMDSRPMWAYGAKLDTIRLLGDGLRMLCGRWAKLTGTTVAALAAQWDLPLLLARSTKAAYRVDWRDRDQRATAEHSLVIQPR